MSKVVLYTACSLDGYIAGPGDGMDWLLTEGDFGYNEFLETVDTLIWGHNTWKIVHTLVEGEPYPDKLNIVYSRQERDNRQANPRFTHASPEELLRGLQLREGKNIWLVGGGEINTLFLDAGCIDEMILSVHPIVLGSGKLLFPGAKSSPMFDVAQVKHFPAGLVQMMLRRRKE